MKFEQMAYAAVSNVLETPEFKKKAGAHRGQL